MSAASNNAPTEWLDIVDSDDRIIGAAPRATVHEKAYMHRAVHIMLCNSAGEVFLQLRSHDKDTNPGLWDTSCAGHIDSGESLIVGPSHDNGFEHVTLYTALSDEPLTLCPAEIIDGKWVRPAVLDMLLEAAPQQFTTTFQLIWQSIRHYFQEGIRDNKQTP